MLTPSEIEEIKEIIRSRFLAITHEALGDKELSEEEHEVLRRNRLVPDASRNMIQDGYEFGKVAALIGPTASAGLTFEQVKRAVMQGGPLTGVEQQSIEFARRTAGEYIRGVGALVLKDVSTSASRASGAALRAIRDATVEALADRDTISEFQTELFSLIDDRNRDWQRVAHTEMGNAIQNGIYHEIRDQSDDGIDQLVYKRPNPDACKYCLALYTKADGTPKIFRLRDLEDTNVGRRARDWVPVIGTTHPWCNCQLHVLPEGFEFHHDWTVKEPFDAAGKEYKRGQLLSNDEADDLLHEFDDKIHKTPVLRYTGDTAEYDGLSRSMENYPIHLHDDLVCDH